jgi:hypothetical protein
MLDKELALGITAAGLIGGLGFMMLKDSSREKDRQATGAHRNPSESKGRLDKLRKSKRAQKKTKSRLDKARLERDDLNQTLNGVKRTMSADEIPAVLWATVRAIFLKNHHRGTDEKTNAFINRVFDSYEAEGLSRNEAVSRAFAIAAKSVQDKGLVMSGTQEATELGHEWQNFYQRDIGQREYSKRFSEFEAIVRQGRKA